MASNSVIGGDYKGASCKMTGGESNHVEIRDIDKGNIPLTKTTIAHYSLVDAEERKSATSGVLRAGVGAFLLGPIGLAAGLSAKRKGIYIISIEFKDGRKSLIEINEEFYKQFIRDVF